MLQIPDQLPWEWAAALLVIGLIIWGLKQRSEAGVSRTAADTDAMATITSTVIEDLLVPLRRELEAARSDLIAVRVENAELKAQIIVMSARLEQLETDSCDVVRLSKENGDLRAEIGRLQKRVRELEGHVKALETSRTSDAL